MARPGRHPARQHRADPTRGGRPADAWLARGAGRTADQAVRRPDAAGAHPDDTDLLRRRRTAAAGADGYASSEGVAGWPAVSLPVRAGWDEGSSGPAERVQRPPAVGCDGADPR